MQVDRGLAVCLSAVTACCAVSIAGAATAKYEEQAEYLKTLRSPLWPAAGDCQALDAAFGKASRQVSEAHTKCLAGPNDSRTGGTCTKASCQGLHNLMDYAQKRGTYERSVCSARLSATRAEMPRQEQLSGAQSRAGTPLKDRAEKVWDHPITQSTVENLKNSTAAAAESGVDEVRPGLKSPTTGTGLGAATTIGGVLLQLGIGLLNPEVATGAKAIYDRRGGRHPADKIIEEDQARYAPTIDDKETARRLRREELREALRPR